MTLPNTGAVYINKPDVAVGTAEYIIFELADSDVRRHLTDFTTRAALAWRLRSLHHIATGLEQLHRHGISHQDTKPSNVLVFGGSISKLADLGRAHYVGLPVAHDIATYAGDPGYVPFDLAYGFVLPEGIQRRFGCDVFHLGSMLVFFLLGVSMTTLTFQKLDPRFHPIFLNGGWNGNFEDVLPYLRVAFEEAIAELRQQLGSLAIADQLTRIVRELCEPDVRLRGHPRNRSPSGNSFSLERYIAEFNTLASKAEAGFYEVRN